MEVNYDLHKYITVFNDVMPKKTLESFKRICKASDKFVGATIIGDDEPVVDENIRKVGTWALHNINTNSYTDVLWCNYLLNHLKICINNYNYFHDLPNEFLLNDIQVLKYGTGGHYKFHVDHGLSIPRSLSFILLLNNDYEGGELQFKEVNSDEIITIENKPGRVIIWPSNFMYSHRVKPVTKGTRYVIVSWLL